MTRSGNENIIVAAVGGMLIRSANESVLETKIIVAAVEVILSFGKQDDQRRLAAMLPAAIGGHAVSGDWRSCRQRRFDTLF